jgi:hypothetical protein
VSGQTTSARTDREPVARRSAVTRWRPDSFTLVAAALFVLTVLAVLQHRWVGDFSLHVATVRTLSEHLVDPVDPMVGTAGGSPYYTPYTLVLALVVRLTGAPAAGVLEVAAVVNVALLLVGWRRFARDIDPRPVVAAASLVFAALLWGSQSFSWSGFTNLYSLMVTGPYPSAFALGIELLAWHALWRYTDDRRTRHLVVLAALVALVALTHPFTGITTVLGLVAIFLGRIREWRWADVGRLAVAAVVVALLVLAWPYSDLTSLLGADNAFSAIHKRLLTDAPAKYWLLLLSVPALLLRARRRLTDPLVLMVALGVLALAGAAVSGSYGWARVIPLVVIAASLALAAELVQPQTRAALRTGLTVAALLGCVAGLVWQWRAIEVVTPDRFLDEATRASLGQPHDLSPWRPLDRLLRPGETVLAATYQARREVNRDGAFTVAPGWPDPFAAGIERRTADAARFFADATTPSERLAIADRYGVRCVLVADRPGLVAQLGLFDRRTRLHNKAVLACRG